MKRAPFAALSARLRHAPVRGKDTPASAEAQATSGSGLASLSGPPPRWTALERRPVEAAATIGFLWVVVLIAMFAIAGRCFSPIQGARGVPSDPSGSRRSPLPPAVGSRDSAVLLPLLASLDAIDLRLHRLAERGAMYHQATLAASDANGCILGVSAYAYRPSEVLAMCRTTPRIGR